MKLAIMLALLGLVSPLSPRLSPSPGTPGEGRGEGSLKVATPLTAQYLEVRTASVFAGPCHINGELMTTGNDALMAWNFTNGVHIMAAISCDENLIQPNAPRQSEIIIDPTAPKAQADAALQAILTHDAATLGKVVAITHGSISFHHQNDEFLIASPGFASADIQALPDCSCCKQPNNVWYEPLTHVTCRMVGYTVNAQYDAARAGESWQREDENGAFYGEVSY